jgi:multicomponent Na+:H+ antiporter subunit D
VSGTHPSIPLFAAAIALPFLRGSARRAAMILGPVLALATLSFIPDGSTVFHEIPGFTLEFLRVDALSRLFATVFCLVGVFGMLYAQHLEDAGESAASLALIGGSLGVVFAGDWLTMFVFWELMTVFSVFVIWYAGTPGSRRAGTRYLLLHVIGGGTLFAGILLHRAGGGAESFAALTQGPMTSGAWLILAGIAVNAAVPPLHTWLTDAYPECSVTGSVVQSAFTTKTAVYALLRAFPGQETLVWFGAVMALYGVVYAVFSNDIRRLLAYHIVSQVGFMVAGVGLGSAMSLDGAAAHAFCHILYKGLLFMSAGAVVTAAGTGKLTELGGLARRLPGVCLFFFVGALSISGAPPFNGFISKTMTLAAFGEAHRLAPEFMLELASVGTFLSIGLKLGWFAFFAEGNPKKKLAPVPNNMSAAMGGLAALCLLFGVWPDLLYRALPFGAAYHPYTAGRILGSLQLHAGTAVGFWIFLGVLAVKPKIALDIDWIYRKPLAAVLRAVIGALKGTGGFLQTKGVGAVYAAVPDEYDVDGKRVPIGMSLFWISLFVGLLAFYAWT